MGPHMEEYEEYFESTDRIEIYLHIVVWTEHRAPWIAREIRPALCEAVERIFHRMGARTLAVGGSDNHLHALAQIGPDRSVDDNIREMMAVSSDWVRCRVPEFSWHDGYGAFTVAPWDTENLREYILLQESHHRTVTFEQEFEDLLRQNGIDFSPEELWEE